MEMGLIMAGAVGTHDWGERLLNLDAALIRNANEAYKANTPEKIAALGAQDRMLSVMRPTPT